MVPGRERLDALTGLRFVAAASVMSFHYWHDQPNFMGRLPITVAGYAGVSLFFVLSGFVLGYNYLDRAAAIRPLAFYWARFARIYPVYVLGAVVTLIYDWGQKGAFVAVPQFAFYLPLVQAWTGRHALDANGVGWTLSVEAFFYALFPLIALRFARLDAQGALRALFLSGIVVLLPQIVACIVAVPREGLNTNGDLGSLFKFYPLFHLPEFTAGVALARFQSVRRSTPPVWRNDLLVLASLASIWLLAASPWRLPWPLTFTGGLLLPFCLLIHALSSGSGISARLLGARPMVLLGEASFALYIFHGPIFWFLNGLLGDTKRVAVVAVVLSVFIYLFFERPARAWLMRLQTRYVGRAVEAAEPAPSIAG